VTADPADSYAPGRSEAETRRLIVQHLAAGLPAPQLRREHRLRAEVVSHDGIQLLPAIVGGWART
jgi:hypothetical protein